MLLRTLLFVCLLGGLALIDAGGPNAQTWQGQLEDGSRIYVDPGTNRPILRSPQGVVTPLWDGVHRLQDGRSVTVREGVMVPNREVIELRRGVPQGATRPFVVAEAPPCVVLVRKVCGLNDECANANPCSHARQLHVISLDEEREIVASGISSVVPQTPLQCAEALKDEAFFVPCTRQGRGRTPTPCGQLMDKVCGKQDQCAAESGCTLSRQLFEMEYRDRVKSLHPERITESGQRCRKAFGDRKMFPSCAD